MSVIIVQSRIPSPVKLQTASHLGGPNQQPPIAALSFPTPGHIQSILQGSCSDERPVTPLSHSASAPTVLLVDVPEHTLPRRAMRPRRNSGDHLPDHESPESALPPKKRKAAPASRGPGKRDRVAYEGFPADPTALRSLTVSNTNKNMKYVSQLDIQVIQKEGIRPESPTSKVRAILEKGENGSKSRGERAKRRAGIKDGTEEASSDKADDEESIQEPESPPRKHPRAPGDEEDYETPTRPSKRPRLDDGQDQQSRKGVKWNKDLQKFWIEESAPLQPSNAPVPMFVKKSCLAPAAKVFFCITSGL